MVYKLGEVQEEMHCPGKTSTKKDPKCEEATGKELEKLAATSETAWTRTKYR